MHWHSYLLALGVSFMLLLSTKKIPNLSTSKYIHGVMSRGVTMPTLGLKGPLESLGHIQKMKIFLKKYTLDKVWFLKQGYPENIGHIQKMTIFLRKICT